MQINMRYFWLHMSWWVLPITRTTTSLDDIGKEWAKILFRKYIVLLHSYLLKIDSPTNLPYQSLLHDIGFDWNDGPHGQEAVSLCVWLCVCLKRTYLRLCAFCTFFHHSFKFCETDTTVQWIQTWFVLLTLFFFWSTILQCIKFFKSWYHGNGVQSIRIAIVLSVTDSYP